MKNRTRPAVLPLLVLAVGACTDPSCASTGDLGGDFAKDTGASVGGTGGAGSGSSGTTGGGHGGGSTTGTTSSGTGGKGGGEVCMPGTPVACYDGPPNTENVGICKGGEKVCNAEGSGFTACLGEVLPLPASCTNTVDQNCTGQASPGCICTPAATMSCYDGPAGTLGVGACTGGTATCDASGMSWGSCMGEVVPAVFENCAGQTDALCTGVAPACTGNSLWSLGFGGVGDQGASRVTIDGAGNIWVAGSFENSFTLGSGASAITLTSAGDTDVYWAEFSPEGAPLRARQFGGPGEDGATGIATDAAGNIIVTGYFSDTVNFGGSPLVSAGGTDAWIAKYDPKGNYLWSMSFGDAANQQGCAVATDSMGNVLLVGNFLGTINLGGGDLKSTGGSNDAFLAKFDKNGTFLWSGHLTNLAIGNGNSLAVDANDGAIVFGTSTGVVTLGVGGPTLAGAGYGLLLVRLEAQLGALSLAKAFAATGFPLADAVVVDPSGNILMGGGFTGTVDFGGEDAGAAGAALASPFPGFSSVFAAKVDATGAPLWSRQWGSTGGDTAYGIATDAAGNVVLTGYLAGGVDFGLGTITSVGSQDVFVAKLRPDSTVLWAKRFGGTSYQAGSSVAVDAAGNEVVVGDFTGTLAFDANPPLVSANSSSSDVFIAKLAP